MAPHAWLGPARCLFIPLIVEGLAGYFQPPDDFRDQIRRRVFDDADAVTGEDWSLDSYFRSISYDQAWIEADISEPVVVRGPSDGPTMTERAIQAQPQSHTYEYVAVVYPTNNVNAGWGMAAPGPMNFQPPRPSNATKGKARFRLEEPVGVWAMEMLHIITGIGDYYNGLHHPENYDEMANAAATHPCSYTKMLAGWLDENDVPLNEGTHRYLLHPVGVSQPDPGERAGVRVPARDSERALYVEARVREDRWDAGRTLTHQDGTSSVYGGIGAPGVVIYEYSPETDSWPKGDPNGPWPPLELRAVLAVGEDYGYAPGGFTITCARDTPVGFLVDVAEAEYGIAVPEVEGQRATTAVDRILSVGLTVRTTGDQSRPDRWVWRQSPDGGVRVTPGSTVTLQLRSGPIE